MRATTMFWTAVAAVACGGALGSACGPRVGDPIPEDAPRRYAEAVCDAYERCGCLGQGFSTVDECRAGTENRFRRVASWPDMQFDLGCFEQLLSALGDDDCSVPPQWDGVPCLAFPSGGRKPNESCVPHWSDDWERGHPGLLAEDQCEGGTCDDGTCGPYEAQVVDLGEPCPLELGVFCTQFTYCAPDGTCTAKVLPGEPCDTPRACGWEPGESPRYYCEGLEPGKLGTCTKELQVGAPCPTDAVEPCQAPAYCSTQGVCESHWPRVCFYAATPAPDAYYARDWVPLR